MLFCCLFGVVWCVTRSSHLIKIAWVSYFLIPTKDSERKRCRDCCSPLQCAGDGWYHANTTSHARHLMGPGKLHCLTQLGKLLLYYINFLLHSESRNCHKAGQEGCLLKRHKVLGEWLVPFWFDTNVVLQWLMKFLLGMTISIWGHLCPIYSDMWFPAAGPSF